MKTAVFAVPLAAVMAGLAAPAELGAQTSDRAGATIRSHSLATSRSGDTVITIVRQDDKTECTVRVGDRTITGSEALSICDRTPMRIASIPADSMARTMMERFRSLDDRAQLFSTPSIASFTFTPNRAALGVTTENRSRDTDRFGAYITAVTPGSPAARAGLRAGDIITAIGEVSLASNGPVRPGTSATSIPASKLVEAVGKLEPGKPVKVEYRRGDRTAAVTVTPSKTVTGVPMERLALRSEPLEFFGSLLADSAPGWRNTITLAPSVDVAGVPSAVSLALSTVRPALRNAELAPMNEGLRNYFGTGTGVLVINVADDAENNLGLLPGDVVLEIGGRAVTTPVQFFRILSSYEKGEEVTFQIMRERAARKLSARIP